MKKQSKKLILVILTFGSIIWVSCGDDNENPDPVFAAPTISVNASSTTAATSETITFTISVDAEAGLSAVKLGSENIQSYDGTSTSDEFSYTYLAETAGEISLVFEVEDAQSQTAETSVDITIEEGINLGFLIFDFSGQSTANETWERESWDVRTITTFDVTGSFISSATAQVVNSQAQFSFAQESPTTDDEDMVLKIEKTQPEGFPNWGGFAHLIFDMGETVDQGTIDALPQWDASSTSQTSGTKVFQVDAYYNDTVDPNVSFSDLTSLTDIFGANPSKGYKVDLTIGSYDSIAFGGHDGDGYFIEYEAYLTAANEWQTLTFSTVGLTRTDAYYPTKATSVASDKIDCIKLFPAAGYLAEDKNPLYLKNLRIVDVE